jgi:hypothetical protein
MMEGLIRAREKGQIMALGSVTFQKSRWKEFCVSGESMLISSVIIFFGDARTSRLSLLALKKGFPFNLQFYSSGNSYRKVWKR